MWTHIIVVETVFPALCDAGHGRQSILRVSKPKLGEGFDQFCPAIGPEHGIVLQRRPGSAKDMLDPFAKWCLSVLPSPGDFRQVECEGAAGQQSFLQSLSCQQLQDCSGHTQPRSDSGSLTLASGISRGISTTLLLFVIRPSDHSKRISPEVSRIQGIVSRPGAASRKPAVAPFDREAMMVIVDPSKMLPI